MIGDAPPRTGVWLAAGVCYIEFICAGEVAHRELT